MWRKGIFAYMRPFTKVAISSALTALVLLSACIDRDNPFDPVNLPRIKPDDIRNKQALYFDSLTAQVEAIREALRNMRADLQADTLALSEVEAKALLVRDTNTTKRQNNEGLRAQNAAQTDARLLVDLILLSYLPLFSPQAEFDALGRLDEQVDAMKNSILVRIDSVNRAHFPELIYSDILQQQILAPFEAGLGEANALAVDTLIWFGRKGTAMLALEKENAAITQENGAIQTYNDSIAFHRNRGDRPVVSNPESLVVSVGRLKPGDTLFLDKGVFARRLFIPGSGTAAKPILFQGMPGGGTVLTSSPEPDTSETVIISNLKHITFKDIVFANGRNSGARIIGGSDSIAFERCDFIGNDRHGLEVISSGVTVSNCRFIGNKWNGIHFQTPPNVAVELSNVLAVQNGRNGIFGSDMKGSIARATLADNALSGIHLEGRVGDLVIHSSILAHNRRFGMGMSGSPAQGSNLGLLNCNFYGNDSGHTSHTLPPSPLIVTLSVEPRFISRDAQGLNYNLRPESELSGLEEAGIVIGWRGE